MKKLFKQFRLPAVGAFIGAAAGFLFGKYIGCSSGTCVITSKPVNSTIYFSIPEALLCSMFQKKKEKA